MTYKILSMDGGLGTTLSKLLYGLHDRLPGDHKYYVDQADLFAGTSVGAMTCLFFANQEKPGEALDDWKAFTDVAFKGVIGATNLFSVVGSLMGFNSIFQVDRLRDCLVDYFGADLTLGDLKHKVLVVTFQLDNEEEGVNRVWQPKVYTNFEGSPDCDELVIDVALRSSALPIGYPIYQSITGTGPAFVDGFVVANNPSMIAVSEVFDDHPLKDIIVLSMGTGANVLGKTMYLDPNVTNGTASWGYRQWLLDPSKPLLLLDLMSQASLESVDLQCRRFLKDRYFRLEPVLVNEMVPDSPDTQEMLQAAANWIENSGWLAP